MRRKMYFPNAASGNEWNRMATLSIRFYSLHPWVHCALYKFVIFEIFVVEKSIRNLSNHADSERVLGMRRSRQHRKCPSDADAQ